MKHKDLDLLEESVRTANPVLDPDGLVGSDEASRLLLLVRSRTRTALTPPVSPVIPTRPGQPTALGRDGRDRSLEHPGAAAAPTALNPRRRRVDEPQPESLTRVSGDSPPTDPLERGLDAAGLVSLLTSIYERKNTGFRGGFVVAGRDPDRARPRPGGEEH